MRKIFLFMMTTLDGYFEGKDHNISWHNVDAEFNTFAIEQLDEVDTPVFGHRTYQLMADYWPTTAGGEDDPDTADRMNSLQKIVFAQQSFSPEWQPTKVYTNMQQLKDVKQRPERKLTIWRACLRCRSWRRNWGKSV